MCSPLCMSNSPHRLVSIKNRLKYVSGFTTYNYKDDSDYWAGQCGGRRGHGGHDCGWACGDRSRSNAESALQTFSLLIVSCSAFVLCCEMNAVTCRVCLLVTVILAANTWTVTTLMTTDDTHTVIQTDAGNHLFYVCFWSRSKLRQKTCFFDLFTEDS